MKNQTLTLFKVSLVCDGRLLEVLNIRALTESQAETVAWAVVDEKYASLSVEVYFESDLQYAKPYSEAA